MGALLLQTGCRYLHHCLLNSLGSTRTLVVIDKYVCEQRINQQGLDFFLYIFPKHGLKIVIDYFPPICISPRRTVHIDGTCSPSRICVGCIAHTSTIMLATLQMCLFLLFSSRWTLPGITCSISVWVWEKWLGHGLSEIPSHASASLPRNCKMYFSSGVCSPQQSSASSSSAGLNSVQINPLLKATYASWKDH